MSIYKVTIQPKKLSQPEKVRKVIALDAENASLIVGVYNKDCIVESAVRQGKEPSTKKVLETLKADFIIAKETNDTALAMQHQKAFYSTLARLESSMGAAQWSMTKNMIPSLPPLCS